MQPNFSLPKMCFQKYQKLKWKNMDKIKILNIPIFSAGNLRMPVEKMQLLAAPTSLYARRRCASLRGYR